MSQHSATAINDRHVNEKEKSYPEEKRLIGKYAASLITADDSILIASGTTMHALAREIVPQGHLTVIAAAINVTNILARDKNIDIIQLGGLVRNTSVSVVGNYAEKMLENFSCSKLFLGVDGIDLDYGLTTTNMMEANLNQIMMQAVQKVVVLADSSKFGRRGFGKICDCSSAGPWRWRPADGAGGTPSRSARPHTPRPRSRRRAWG